MLSLFKNGLKAAARQPWLHYSRSRRKLVRPVFLDYAVTWRCNARCVMCDTWQNTSGPEEELSPKQWQDILRRDRDFLSRVGKLGLTGGEPFLRGDLVELLRVLHRGLPRARISVVSNGLMTERILRALEEIRGFCPDLVFSVSLDGLDQVHDKVRGIPGAFAKSLATIKGALELGFTVTSGMTISSLNYDQIGPVSRMLSGLGVDFSCNLMETGANFHTGGEARAQGLDPEQARQVHGELKQFGHHYYMDQIRQSLEGRPRTLPCYSGLTSYFLHPNGDLAICNLLGKPLGNLRQEPFAAIAGSPRTWQRRESLKGCTCWSQCEVKNSAAMAPWHVLGWALKNPQKGRFVRHYAKKSGLMPR